MPVEEHPQYITVSRGMAGYFAVLLWWNPEHGGFYEPWTTSDFRYRDRADAVKDAREWGEAEGIEVRCGD